jgi:nitroimidazol reductase NimA-like FMN-containing flavoprotein (pyridoxamine 5'-phosphate oxidase superfamily)
VEENQIKTNKIRRKDRQVEDVTWIEEFLEKAAFAAIATSLDGQPFINHNLFAYDSGTHSIFFHSADSGQLIKNIRANPQVCLSCAEIGRLLPASRAREFSVEYRSVVVFGTAEELVTIEERRRGLDMLMKKYAPMHAPGIDYPEIDEEEMRSTAVYRLCIQSWSGKCKNAAEDFEGAYHYPPE